MSNEEKILAMLSEMKADISDLKDEQARMRADMGQMQADMGQMQTTLTRVAVTQENVVIPQIKLLAEGHEMLLQKLARKERVEALEDDVALLKAVIKTMSQRITDLEKTKSETA